ncbi:hypothetical protein ACFLRC_01740 [Candidatus Altiarchaeota archaeon]
MDTKGTLLTNKIQKTHLGESIPSLFHGQVAKGWGLSKEEALKCLRGLMLAPSYSPEGGVSLFLNKDEAEIVGYSPTNIKIRDRIIQATRDLINPSDGLKGIKSEKLFIPSKSLNSMGLGE